MGSVIPADVAAPDVRLARRRQVEAAVDELRRALREEAPIYMQHVAAWAKALDHEAPKLKPWPAAVRVAADRLRTPELQAARDRTTACTGMPTPRITTPRIRRSTPD